jgi:hypothetical protein
MEALQARNNRFLIFVPDVPPGADHENRDLVRGDFDVIEDPHV